MEFGADPFEAGEAVDAVDAVGGGDGVLERRGDEGFDDGGVWRAFLGKDAEFFHPSDTEFCEH